MDQLRLAYSGPDTLRKPTMFPFEGRDDILYMGQPPVLSKEKTTTTKAATTPTTVATTPSMNTHPKVVNHQVINIQERDEEIEREQQAKIEAETIRIREKIFQDQQAHFHKGNV